MMLVKQDRPVQRLVVTIGQDHYFSRREGVHQCTNPGVDNGARTVLGITGKHWIQVDVLLLGL